MATTIIINSNINLNANEREAFTVVLAEKFSNGFAYSSLIQIGRLRRFVAELLGNELGLTDDEIANYVKQCGTEFDGKIHIVSTETEERIKQSVNDYLENGATSIFYESFFENNESWLMESGIVSVEMLISVLRKMYRMFPLIFFTETFFGHTLENISSVITNEILRVWGDDNILTYPQIADRLLYIPYWRVKQTISTNNDFIINRRETSAGDGECIHVNRIEITEEDKKEIQERVAKNCFAHQYVSLSDIDIIDLIERNCGLSTSAIHTVIYQICLGGSQGNYDRRGKIITRKGDDINALHIMKEHCRLQDKITLDELLAFEEELTGEQHRWIPMQAGYETLVRIDEQNFIADKYLDFDVDAVDIALERFLHGSEYTPLQAVLNFGMFPHCGQDWNLFLLESYARKFSRNFRFETRSVNSKNVGAIVRKYSRLTYEDIMADCVARSDTPLNGQAVLNYLLENGLVSQRRHSDIDDLLRKIKKIRERRN